MHYLLFIFIYVIFVNLNLYAQKDCCREKAIQRFSFLKKTYSNSTISNNLDGTFVLRKPYTNKDKNSYPQSAYEQAIAYYHINLDSAIYYYNEAAINEYDPDEAVFMLHSYFLKRTNYKLDQNNIRRLQSIFNEKYGNSKYTDIIYEIHKMYALDQSVRSFGLICNFDTVQFKDVNYIDSINLISIKNIYIKYGYPTISMVGSQNQNRLFILVQHADRDTMFQKIILEKMKLLLLKNEVNKENYAFLFDRVMTATKGLQYYATQYGNFPIIDSEGVNERRSELNLPPVSNKGNSTTYFNRHIDTSIKFPEIFFNVNDYKVNKQGLDSLNVVLKWMNKNTTAKIDIIGSADETGNATDNIVLSLKRAEEIAKQLQMNCVHRSRMNIKAMGELPSTISDKQKSRKVHINIAK